jgi:hypothetical protein
VNRTRAAESVIEAGWRIGREDIRQAATATALHVDPDGSADCLNCSTAGGVTPNGGGIVCAWL